MIVCNQQDCGNQMHSRGLCMTHYTRFRRAGTLESVAKPKVKASPKKQVSLFPRPIKQVKDSVKTGAGTYIITSVQNNTRIDTGFFDCLKTVAEDRDAEILFVPVHYFPHGKMDVVFDKQLDNLVTAPRRLASDLVIYPNVNTISTAARPLSGLGSFGGNDSLIIGHPKTEMESVATPQGQRPKFMYTTGSLTIPNYTTSRRGAHGEFHHTMSALIVEVLKDDTWFVRQLHRSNVEGGVGIYDVDKLYLSDAIFKTNTAGLVLGDIHVDQTCRRNHETVWGERGVVSQLLPESVILHDVFDMYSKNPHESKSSHTNYRRWAEGRRSVSEELERCNAYLSKLTHDNLIMPHSNHDRMLYRWLEEADIRLDPTNAELFYRAKLFLLEGRPDELLKWGLESVCPLDNVTFLGEDEGFRIEGIEVGQHGDGGANGARGNPRQFANLGLKTVTGHTHTAGIFNGAYVVGTSSKLKMNYTKGLSSWSHTHCIIHWGGKRQLITLNKNYLPWAPR